MRIPNVINTVTDTLIAIDGDTVIHDVAVYPTFAAQDVFDPADGTTLTPTLYIWNLTSGVETTISATMTYRKSAKIWTMTVASLSAALVDKNKFIATVVDATSAPNNFRTFKIGEFTVDNDQADDILFNLGFEISIGTASYINYYSGSTLTYQAPAYQGGTGTVYATRPDEQNSRTFSRYH